MTTTVIKVLLGGQAPITLSVPDINVVRNLTVPDINVVRVSGVVGSGNGGGAQYLTDLLDVNAVPPTGDDAGYYTISWDSSTSKWIPNIPGLPSLDYVSGVTTGTTNTGGILYYDGEKWESSTNIANPPVIEDISNTKDSVSDIEGVLRISSNNTSLYRDSSDVNKSYLNLNDSDAFLGLKNTGVNVSQSSTGQVSFSVDSGSSGSETEFEALRIEGSTTADTSSTTVSDGNTLSFEKGQYKESVITPTLSSDIEITLPSVSGTLALSSDLPTALSDLTGNSDDINEGSSNLFMTSAERTKLTGIEDSATANSRDETLLDRGNHTGTQLASTISDFDTEVGNNTAVVLNTAKISYPSADATKLAGIEAGAEVNPTAAETKTAYESNTNTNAFTDAEQTKLAGIAAGAEVNVNADWTATTGDAQILNKPTLGAAATSNDYYDLDSLPSFAQVATSGAYSDLSGTPAIPAYIDDLTDVDTSTTAPTNGQCLVWDSTTSNWIPGTISGGGGSSLWTASGSNIYYTSGNVGIGTISPSEAIDVVGRMKLKDTSSTSNIIIHSGAAPTSLTTAADGNVIIGDLAGNSLTTQDDNIMIGKRAGESVNSGFGHMFIGALAGEQVTSGGQSAMAIGYVAMRNANPSNYGTAIGREAGRFGDQSHGFSLGFQAGYWGAAYSAYVGSTAGKNARGQRNVGIGYQALNSASNQPPSVENVGFGTIAIGNQALYNAGALGTGMISIGYQAGYNSITNGDCIFIGRGAGFSTTSGNSNILIGTDAGYSAISASGNVFIGYQAGYNETGSNKLYITNSNTAQPLIYGEFDNDLLRINGKLEIGEVSSTGFEFPTTTGTQGQILELDTDGSTLIWVHPDTLVQAYLTAEKIRANYPTAEFTGNTSITSSHEQSMMIGNSATGITFQVSAGLSRDCEILVMQYGAGDITITGATGVTIRTTSDFQAVTGGQYSIIGLKQIGTTDEYIVTGERKPV